MSCNEIVTSQCFCKSKPRFQLYGPSTDVVGAPACGWEARLQRTPGGDVAVQHRSLHGRIRGGLRLGQVTESGRRLSAAACAKKAAGRRRMFFQIDSVFFAKIDGYFFRFSRKVLRNAPTLAIRNVHKAENEICEVCPLSVDRYPRWEPWSECSCSGIQDRSRRIVRCRRWISAQAASAAF